MSFDLRLRESMQLLNWPKASQKQYQALFGLEEKVFSKPILEYRCGTTLLNARHPLVTSMDEIFAYPPDTINAHLKDENIPLDFYQDYVKGYKEGRYLPLKDAKKLPFADFRFDTALCTYPLFESDKSSEDVIKELDELLRVAKVVYLAPHQFDSEKIANI